jgi:hypothetical protein
MRALGLQRLELAPRCWTTRKLISFFGWVADWMPLGELTWPEHGC